MLFPPYFCAKFYCLSFVQGQTICVLLSLRESVDAVTRCAFLCSGTVILDCQLYNSYFPKIQADPGCYVAAFFEIPIHAPTMLPIYFASLTLEPLAPPSWTSGLLFPPPSLLWSCCRSSCHINRAIRGSPSVETRKAESRRFYRTTPEVSGASNQSSTRRRTTTGAVHKNSELASVAYLSTSLSPPKVPTRDFPVKIPGTAGSVGAMEACATRTSNITRLNGLPEAPTLSLCSW